MSKISVSETKERILESDVSSCAGKQTLLLDRYTNTIMLEVPSASNYLDSFGRRRTQPIILHLEELLCVRTSPAYIRRGVPVRGDATDSKIDSTLCFIFAFKKDQNCLRLKQLQVKFKSDEERDEWENVLTAAMKGSDRPKNIVVFINPFGGLGKALSIFQDEVEPIFKIIASLHYEVLITQRANHARDYIMEMPAEQWRSVDSLISVGGDGLFNEVLSGALIRTQQEAGIAYDKPEHLSWKAPHLRFGIIAAGSTNSIARTVHGIHDHTTAALHIVLGLKRKMDICSVHGDNHLLRISANAIAYCWTGDLLRDSERYRYLGPARYELSAVRTTLRHPTYKGKVSFSLSPKAENSSHSPCLSPCKECESSSNPNHQVLDTQYDHHWHTEFTHIICYVIPTYISYFPYPLAPSTGVDDGTLDLILVPKISRLHNVQFMKNLAIHGGKEVVRLDWATRYFRVHRWSFEPDDNEVDTGVWNVDGEILEQPKNTALHFRLHPRLINIFGHESSTDFESDDFVEDERF